MNYEYFLFIDLFMISKLISNYELFIDFIDLNFSKSFSKLISNYELFIDFIDLNFSKSFSKLFSIYELFMKYEYFSIYIYDFYL